MLIIDIETTGLRPSPTPKDLAEGIQEDYIVAIGILDTQTGCMEIFSAPHSIFSVSLANTEKMIILNFCRWFVNQQKPIFLSYNGIDFDIPFIVSKLLKYDKEETNGLSTVLLSTPHIDLIRFSVRVSGRRMQKETACRKLGNLYVPRKSEGLWCARIYSNPQLLTANDHLDMLQHNATDLSATGRLYNVLKQFPDFETWVEEQIGSE